MSHVIGIDLGTTNSCVAVPESVDIPNKEELLATRRLIPSGGALVIADQKKAQTTPSAVWVDRDGTVVVGSRAKQMAKVDGVPPPALFFKRLMGTDQEVTAGHRTMTPEEASGHVLRHLKKVAEEVLGGPVQRAVVTVPAFFETKAKNLTTEAGERAGLEVVETLLEPVAAALMYTRTRDLVDPMTFMVYDLGGGTFDNSIVTWDPDTGFENRSFDGNQYLGGYDFDWKIVQWMISQLGDYDLHLDRDDPRDHEILYRLLSLAEQAKHDLSRQLEVLISETTIRDRAGIPMNVHLYLSRDIFEQAIDEETRGTLASCDLALEKAAMSVDDLSAVVMVGGSSNIPHVRKLLADRYHREPIVIDPDLCVAVGAALKAATVATRSSYLTVERPPAITSLSSLDIAGRVLCGAAVPSAAGVTVQLSSDDGGVRRQEVTNAEGGFLFDDVALQEESENGFTIQVFANGRPADSQKLTITHDWNTGGGDLIPEGDILAHDFLVAVRGGRHRIATAGTKLPHRATTVNLETATQRGEVSIEFYEENRAIGKVNVRGLPPELPIGSAVLVDLAFNKGWTVSATAKIPAAGSAAVQHAELVLPKMTVPSWSELDQRRQRVSAELESTRNSASQSEHQDHIKVVDANLRTVNRLVSEQHDPAHAQHKLSEAETLLSSVRAAESPELSPPLVEFEAALTELEQLVSRLEAKDRELGARHRAGIDSVRTDGRVAYAAGNAIGWSVANDTVQERIAVVKNEIGGDTGLPPAPVIQLMIVEELKDLIGTIDQANRDSSGRFTSEFSRLRRETQTIMTEVERIDLSDEQAALGRLVGTYRSKVRPLREAVDAALDQAFGQQPSGPGSDLRLPDSSFSGGNSGRRDRP